MINIDNIGIGHDENAGSSPPRWMISFADLLSLILSFFVMLYSMSAPADSPIESTGDRVSEYEKKDEAAFSVTKNKQETSIELARTDQTLSTNYLYDVMQEKITKHAELSKIEVKPLPDRLVLTFGKDQINNGLINAMAVLLNTIQNKTEIYSADLDESYQIAEKLHDNGLKREISFFSTSQPQGKIDIIIYP